MEYEVNSKPFDEHELVDDVIEADNEREAALAFAAHTTEQVTVYVRALGTRKTVAVTVEAVKPDEHYVEAVAWRLNQAAFFAQAPKREAHVLAKSWMTQAFYLGGKIRDFETRVKAVQLLIHFDLFVADCIKERCHARN